MNNVQLEIVKEFKYLGIILADNGSFNTAVSTIAGQALMTKFVKIGYPTPIILSHVFDVLLVSVMEYGSEIWGG